jgi:hypothetical protein
MNNNNKYFVTMTVLFLKHGKCIQYDEEIYTKARYEMKEITLDLLAPVDSMYEKDGSSVILS